ncbi:hypothetical protein HDV04_001283 [Boothiomyces sp. JEL0838]|nr:hypothetical protein HDV04_001283 [Boothiomyces sp. JEL0838]
MSEAIVENGDHIIIPQSSTQNLREEEDIQENDIPMEQLTAFQKTKKFIMTLAGFLGPGFMVAVGYLDPGNWATDLAAGSQYGYLLLFIILLSNLMAVLLQSMCVRLGVVKGLDLAQLCRRVFPRWAYLILYVLTELAIMATDLAEVIGSAIALKLLFKIPMFWGVLLTAADVMMILFAWKPENFRYFEFLIFGLVFTCAICLFIVAGKSNPVFSDVMYGFLPKWDIITAPGALYVSVGIIGATVMPHNLYLHSSIVQQRSGFKANHAEEVNEVSSNGDANSLIRETDTQLVSRLRNIPTFLQMSWLDSAIALTFALFVNASILIISSANFYTIGRTDIAEIPDAFNLIGELLGSAFATVFATALLISGQSSTITGTMAGQIIMEGFLGGEIKIQPWVRRLVTRLLAIAPPLICIVWFGENRLNDLLILSQIVLSLQLPFAVWPLIYFTSSKQFMTVTFVNDEAEWNGNESANEEHSNIFANQDELVELDNPPQEIVKCFANHTITTVLAVIVGLLLTIFNVILLVQVATGNT